MRIDAHQHYWVIGANDCSWPTPGLSAIFGDRLPADLEPKLAALGIGGTVLVQSQPSDRDTDFLIDLAGRTDSVKALVGWVDMKAPDAPQRIAALAEAPKLRGLRPMLQDLEDEWILGERARPALEAMVAHGLSLDALIRPRHLRAIAVLAARYPGLAIVVDHGAKPDIAGDVREPWARDIAALAAIDGVHCKLSGLVTEAGASWTAEGLRFFVDHLLACFGPERTMWGSDWPVVDLAAPYEVWLETAMVLAPEADRAAILGGTAARFYRIG